jgi:hypothetical protein
MFSTGCWGMVCINLVKIKGLLKSILLALTHQNLDYLKYCESENASIFNANLLFGLSSPFLKQSAITIFFNKLYKYH